MLTATTFIYFDERYKVTVTVTRVSRLYNVMEAYGLALCDVTIVLNALESPWTINYTFYHSVV